MAIPTPFYRYPFEFTAGFRRTFLLIFFAYFLTLMALIAGTYSTGMKKKLVFMGLLLQNNDFFILDEPFNGVDIHSNILIEAIIHQLKAAGKTIVISSHIFSTLQEACDEINLLKKGQLVKKVERADFGPLEAEMRDFVVGDRLARIGLG